MKKFKKMIASLLCIALILTALPAGSGFVARADAGYEDAEFEYSLIEEFDDDYLYNLKGGKNYSIIVSSENTGDVEAEFWVENSLENVARMEFDAEMSALDMGGAICYAASDNTWATYTYSYDYDKNKDGNHDSSNPPIISFTASAPVETDTLLQIQQWWTDIHIKEIRLYDAYGSLLYVINSENPSGEVKLISDVEGNGLYFDPYIYTINPGEVIYPTLNNRLDGVYLREIEWYYSDPSGEHTLISEGYLYPYIAPKYSGSYGLKITDVEGNSREYDFYVIINNNVDFYLTDSSAWIVDREACLTKKDGDSFTLSPEVIGYMTANGRTMQVGPEYDDFTYQWYRQGELDDYGEYEWEKIEGAVSLEYTINDWQKPDDRTYDKYLIFASDKYRNAYILIYSVGYGHAYFYTLGVYPYGKLYVSFTEDDPQDKLHYVWYEYTSSLQYQTDPDAVLRMYYTEESELSIDLPDDDRAFIVKSYDECGRFIDYKLFEYTKPAEDNDPIKITSQPYSSTPHLNDTVVFNVQAEGEGLTYQWEVLTDAADTFVPSGLTGNKTNTLKVKATAGRNGYRFRCKITDKYGNEDYSEEAELCLDLSRAFVNGEEVPLTPSIDNYKGMYVGLGSQIELTIDAYPGDVKYQWYVSKDEMESWNPTGLTGNKTAKLKFEATKKRHRYAFYCEITDKYGNTRESSIFVINVNNVFIEKEPNNIYVNIGKTADLSFGIYGYKDDLKYQWETSKDGGNTWKNSGLVGNKTEMLSVAGTIGRDGYKFRCHVWNDKGFDDYSGEITLKIVSIQIVKQPVLKVVQNGSVASFTVSAEGEGLKYQWQSSTDGGTTWSNSGLSGNKTAKLSVRANETRNGYFFRCVITDKYGKKVITRGAALRSIN